MRFTCKMKNAVRSRVQSVTIRCSDCKKPSYETIYLDKQYTIIITKYLMSGGDQYKMIKEGIINAVNLSERLIEWFNIVYLIMNLHFS